MRKAGLRGNTVRVKIRWRDFTTLSRQQTLPQPVEQDDEIEQLAWALFRAAWSPGQAVRLVGVAVSGFDEGGAQMELWQDEADAEKRKLQSALDDLRSRFGENIIQRGSDLRRKQ
jgi:DNA polymerase-4